MSNDLNRAIEGLESELATAEKRVSELKKTINNVCAMMGEPPKYSDADFISSFGAASIRPDQFFGKALTTAIREFLRMRGRAATAQEILEGLKTGGFEFPSEWGAKYLLRNLTISMSKNRNDFVYVKSSKAYGLWEFYPEKKRERQKGQKEEGPDKKPPADDIFVGLGNGKDEKTK